MKRLLLGTWTLPSGNSVDAVLEISPGDTPHYEAHCQWDRFPLTERDMADYLELLDIHLQQSPPPGHESNWLPTPAGRFALMMRIYLPEPTVLDGTYRLPAVTPN